MSESKRNFSIEVEGIGAVCPLGEVVGNKMIAEGKIPVISCEGGCFRGEIARVAAHIVAKEEPYSRGCHDCPTIWISPAVHPQQPRHLCVAQTPKSLLPVEIAPRIVYHSGATLLREIRWVRDDGGKDG